MPDLSQLSDAELLGQLGLDEPRAATPSPVPTPAPSGLSALSDRELLGALERTPLAERGLESLKQLGAGAVEGTVGLGTLAADVLTGGARGLVEDLGRVPEPLAEKFGIEQRAPGDPRPEFEFPLTRRAQEIIKEQLPESDLPEARYARTVGEFVGPGGVISGLGRRAGVGLATRLARGAAVDVPAAVGAQAAEDITGDDGIAPIVGGLAGGLAPTAAKAAARKLGTKVAGKAQPLEMRAFGVGKTEMKKANANNFHHLVDDSGEVVNPMQKAVQSFRQRAGKNIKDHDPNDLLVELQRQEGEIIGELSTRLDDVAEKQAVEYVPEFRRTKEYVDDLFAAEAAQGREMADDIVAEVLERIDPKDIRSIHKEKVRLGRLINDSAWGKDATALKSNIYKRIYADLRGAVEDGYQAISGLPGKEIAELNKELGMRIGLRKSFIDMLTTSQSTDIVERARQLFRTSGGWSSPAALATYGSGLGVPAALGVYLTGRYVQSPRGKLFLSNVSKAIGESLTSAGAKPSMPLGEMFTRESGLQFMRQFEESLGEDTKELSGMLSESPQEPKAGMLAEAPEAKPGLLPAPPKKKAKSEPMSKITEDILDAQEWMESRGKADAIGPATKYGRAKGAYQFLDTTAEDIRKQMGLTGEYDYTNKAEQRQMAKFYNEKLLDRFGTPELALAAYNWGQGNLSKALKKVGTEEWSEVKKHVPKETRNYVDTILKRSAKV